MWREYLRNSLPGFLCRRWRDAREDRRLERLTEMEAHGFRIGIEGIDLAIKKYLAHGKYEEAEIAACKAHLNREDRVLEIGAGLGLVGLYCQKHLGIKHYTSVEANPNTIERLRANYAMNGMAAEVLGGALDEADGQIDFNVGPLLWADSTVARTNDSRTISVKSWRLETLIGSISPAPTALIIDIEGGESALLKAAIPAAVRILIIELHPEIIGTETVCALITQWIREGFALADVHARVYVFRRGH